MELFRRSSGRRIEHLPAPLSPTSCPNSAPITPNRTTAVVCFRRNSVVEEGLRNPNSEIVDRK